MMNKRSIRAQAIVKSTNKLLVIESMVGIPTLIS